MHVRPDRGVDGSVTSVVVVGHDETAHAQAERTLRRELQAREEVLSAALLAAGAGVVEVDRDGRISGWSAAQETLTGVARADAIGRPVWEVQAALLPSEARRPENVERVRAAFAVLLSAAASGREGAPVPFLVERPDGTRRLLEMTAIVDRGGAETGESTGRGALLVTRAVEPRPRADRPGGDHGPA
jgi:PAS domain S-box-containing protein